MQFTAWLQVFMLYLIPPVSCKLQEMSWKMYMDHISYFPVYKDPEFQYTYTSQSGPWQGLGHQAPFVAHGTYSTAEHMGTHMDAPYHFSQNGRHIDEIALEDLYGPLVQINIAARASEDKDAAVTVEDLEKWESNHGTIPPRAFVLMYSDWDKYYGDNAKYLGMKENSTEMHFPGISVEASDWLVKNRDILGIGTDTVSCDPGYSIVATHLSILPADKLCIENLKDVGKVPECGAKFMMLPIMLKNGSGSQGRAFAEWYPGFGYMTTCKGKLKKIGSFLDPNNKETLFEGSGAGKAVVSTVMIGTAMFLSLH